MNIIVARLARPIVGLYISCLIFTDSDIYVFPKPGLGGRLLQYSAYDNASGGPSYQLHTIICYFFQPSCINETPFAAHVLARITSFFYEVAT